MIAAGHPIDIKEKIKNLQDQLCSGSKKGAAQCNQAIDDFVNKDLLKDVSEDKKEAVLEKAAPLFDEVGRFCFRDVYKEVKLNTAKCSADAFSNPETMKAGSRTVPVRHTAGIVRRIFLTDPTSKIKDNFLGLSIVAGQTTFAALASKAREVVMAAETKTEKEGKVEKKGEPPPPEVKDTRSQLQAFKTDAEAREFLYDQRTEELKKAPFGSLSGSPTPTSEELFGTLAVEFNPNIYLNRYVEVSPHFDLSVSKSAVVSERPHYLTSTASPTAESDVETDTHLYLTTKTLLIPRERLYLTADLGIQDYWNKVTGAGLKLGPFWNGFDNFKVGFKIFLGASQAELIKKDSKFGGGFALGLGPEMEWGFVKGAKLKTGLHYSKGGDVAPALVGWDAGLSGKIGPFGKFSILPGIKGGINSNLDTGASRTNIVPSLGFAYKLSDDTSLSTAISYTMISNRQEVSSSQGGLIDTATGEKPLPSGGVSQTVGKDPRTFRWDILKYEKEGAYSVGATLLYDKRVEYLQTSLASGDIDLGNRVLGEVNFQLFF